jgi:hypothetical protein
MDGQGSFIGVGPSTLDAAAIGKSWILGFRADEMKFHWIFDEAHAGEKTIVVNSLNVHGNNVISEGVFLFGDPAPQMSERSVGAEQISLRENQIVLNWISNLPYAAGRSYINEDPGVAKTAPKTEPSTSQTASCEWKLVIREDGTVALQDVLVPETALGRRA